MRNQGQNSSEAPGLTSGRGIKLFRPGRYCYTLLLPYDGFFYEIINLTSFIPLLRGGGAAKNGYLNSRSKLNQDPNTERKQKSISNRAQI